MDITEKQKAPQPICDASRSYSDHAAVLGFLEIIPEHTRPSAIMGLAVDPLHDGWLVSKKPRHFRADREVARVSLELGQQIVIPTLQVAVVSGPSCEIKHQGQRANYDDSPAGGLSIQWVLRDESAGCAASQNNREKQKPTANAVQPAFAHVVVHGAAKQIKFEVVGGYFGGTTLGGWPFVPGDRVGADGCGLGVAGGFAHLNSPISNISPLSLSHWGCGRSRHGTVRPASFDNPIHCPNQHIVVQHPTTTLPRQENTMASIPCPRRSIAKLQNQELRIAREIIRQRASHDAGTVDLAMASIARLSPHQFESDAAQGALASRQLAA